MPGGARGSGCQNPPTNAGGGGQRPPGGKAVAAPGDEDWSKVNMNDPRTWPTPPGDGGPYREGPASRAKPAARGEKSLYDSEGGEWRPHLPDSYHDTPHWNYRPPGPNQPWQNIAPDGMRMP